MSPKIEHRRILNQETMETEKHIKSSNETSMVPHIVNPWPLLEGIHPEESLYLETELGLLLAYTSVEQPVPASPCKILESAVEIALTFPSSSLLHSLSPLH
jgi:hypothetical protein